MEIDAIFVQYRVDKPSRYGDTTERWKMRKKEKNREGYRKKRKSQFQEREGAVGLPVTVVADTNRRNSELGRLISPTRLLLMLMLGRRNIPTRHLRHIPA